jgi:CRP/FNR family transcriptional regulator
MESPDRVRALKAVPHFRLLDGASLQKLAAAVRFRKLESGEAVFFERDPADAFFAVRTGGVKLYRLRPDGREQIIHTLAAGATFAEAAVFNLDFYPVNAVATETPTELIAIPKAPLQQMLREDDRIAGAIIASMSMRMLELVERVEELASASAAARLARYLLRLPSTGPATRPTVELPVAKKDLAARLAIAPETLSRVLRKWEQAGIVDSASRTIALLDPGKLLAIADGEGPPALAGSM